MSEGTTSRASWIERSVDRSAAVQRNRSRRIDQATTIVQAAKRLIARNHQGFTTQELTKEAGIAIKTLYRYFETKDDILLAVIEDLVNESAATFRQAAHDLAGPIERLRFYVTAVINILDDTPDIESARFLAAEHWRLLAIHPEATDRVSRQYNELLREEIEIAARGDLIKVENAAGAAHILTQLIRAEYMYYAFMPSTESIDAISERLWSFCLNGLNSNASTIASVHPTPTVKRPTAKRKEQ